jgi:hypothetical protein
MHQDDEDNGPKLAEETANGRGYRHCPSSDDLRHFVSVNKRGSGSSGGYLMPRAVGAASGDL